MNRISLFAAVGLSVGGLGAAEPPVWEVIVDPSAEIASVKPMNGVNGGPTVRFKGNADDWRHARIPFGRTHDMNHSWEFGGPHTIDVDAVFPDFAADEDDPKNYDFFYTDLVLEKMRACGTEPFYRLGPSIEGGAKKYHTHPPKDFAKWARICERIIRHCNEGWADGRHDGIRYWEIWFEPDIGANAWSGTKQEFLTFYRTAAVHLKGRFPALRIGGPAFATHLGWKEDFIPFCQREKVPLDFYSWHFYGSDVHDVGRRAREVRTWLDDHGFEATESVLDEWNYVLKWTGGAWTYSRQVESGSFIQKGAAFAAAMMAACQGVPVDKAMYYDTRAYGGMNMLFDPVANRAMKGYYPFFAWGKMAGYYGTQVKATVNGPKKDGQLFVTAAKDPHGRLAVWIARYSDDDNDHEWLTVKVRLPDGMTGGRTTCHLTDDRHTHTEIALDGDKDGACVLTLVPNAFALLEFEGR